MTDNFRITIDIPSHPILVTAVTKSIDSIGQALTNLAGSDLKIARSKETISDVLEEGTREGDLLNAKQWDEYLTKMSDQFGLLTETALNMWAGLYGPGHPMSKLAKMTESGASAHDYYAAIKEVLLALPDLDVHVSDAVSSKEELGEIMDDLEIKIESPDEQD